MSITVCDFYGISEPTPMSLLLNFPVIHVIPELYIAREDVVNEPVLQVFE